MVEKEQKIVPYAALQIAEFRNLMMGRFIFIMGLRMLSTLVGWWIYNLTNAPIAIGFVGLSEFVPAVSFALYAGHVIDISEKRKLILRGVFLYLVGALLLLFFVRLFCKQSYPQPFHRDRDLYNHIRNRNCSLLYRAHF